MRDIESIVENLKEVLESKEELNEENTKMYFILPMMNYLGYDYTNRKEVRAEYIADVREKGVEKCDYAILSNGNPVILMECKPLGTNLENCHAQLYSYFAGCVQKEQNPKIAILTDGNKYLFYGAYQRANVLDSSPCYTMYLSELKEKDKEFLSLLKKNNIDYIEYSVRGFIKEKKLNALLDDCISVSNENFLAFINSQLDFKIIKDDLRFFIEKKLRSLRNAEDSDIVEEGIAKKEEKKTFSLAKKRSVSWVFSAYGIPIGAELVNIDNGDTVKVVTEKTVEYKGQEMSLSAVSQMISPTHGRGPQYFTYQGKLLVDIRKELENG